jgi:N-acetylneuraminic acid mutarotase
MKGRSIRHRLTLGAAMRGAQLMTAALALVACGGHKSSSSSGPFTVGGTISGLDAGSVVLAYTGSSVATVTVAAGATTWVFPGAFAADSSYAVTVATQPIGELCEVIGASSAATLTADVSDVTVVCSHYGQWIWEAGMTTVNATGIYGTQQTSSVNNMPGGRSDSSSWTDASGNFWLFGGAGYDSTGASGSLNDLWEYSPGTGQWTWVTGANTANASGVYGTQGTAAAGSVPGARYAASSWIDTAGNMWLFGGYGYDSTGAVGRLNDLWRYTPSTRLWTWISGGAGDNAIGVYGTQGTAAAGSVPGARESAISWTDTAGNLWLFGGVGYDSTGAVGDLSDLWQYSPDTGLWTWVSGGSVDNASGIYGTLGTAAAGNLPGARQAANAWIDSSNNLWLFGGYGYDSAGHLGYLNDLWQFNPGTAMWTWINGANTDDGVGVYGTQGTAASGNTPGGRQAASSWTDSSGNFWLFGGAGYASSGGVGSLNDLWEYSPSGGQWNWVGGSNEPNSLGSYGTQGAPSTGTSPGARYAASAWIDSSNNLWLFGGAGNGSATNGYLNDLWQFEPP